MFLSDSVWVLNFGNSDGVLFFFSFIYFFFFFVLCKKFRVALSTLKIARDFLVNYEGF